MDIISTEEEAQDAAQHIIDVGRVDNFVQHILNMGRQQGASVGFSQYDVEMTQSKIQALSASLEHFGTEKLLTGLTHMWKKQNSTAETITLLRHLFEGTPSDTEKGQDTRRKLYQHVIQVTFISLQYLLMLSYNLSHAYT